MDPSIISSGLLLAAVLIAIGAVAYGVTRARKATRDISRVAFGTDNLLEGFKKAEADLENTPKSLSAQTSLAMQRIRKDFPQFNYEEMRERANNVIISYLRCVDQNDAGLLTEGNVNLKHSTLLKLEMLRNAQQREQYDLIKIHRTEISSYVKRNGSCIVTFQCALQSKHSIADSSGAIIKGSADRWEQSRWEADLVYIQDADKLSSPELAALGLTCPNCGAPIANLGNKTCEYCGTGITEININAWSFNAVRKA